MTTTHTGLPVPPSAAPATDLVSSLRPEALGAPESGIVELFNYGRGRPGLIPMWVGEGDLPTPPFLIDAAYRSMQAGETFYTQQRGTPELRKAIADYMARIYGTPFGGHQGAFAPERFFVTVGGMHALQIAIRMIAGQGDEAVLLTPAWPNFAGALATCGAHPVEAPLSLAGEGEKIRWTLDIERVVAALTPRTRALIVNTPSNPSGWTATREELVALLELARKHGLWIIADEIYGRIVFDGKRAPSFHDIIAEDDRVVFVQTLSKNWSMTGLRVGWLETPPALGQVVENLIQYSTSGVAVPLQRAATLALETGEHFFGQQLRRIRESRDVLCDQLAATGRVRFARPPGAFYLFCEFDGFPDTRALALRLVDEANVGVAPGTAFGTGAAGYLRMCFACNPDITRDAAQRLANWLRRQPPAA